LDFFHFSWNKFDPPGFQHVHWSRPEELYVQDTPLLRSQWYRDRAADCSAMAAHAPDAKSKAVLEEMAATWLRLAELVDKWELR
jgi:hypothetical protein